WGDDYNTPDGTAVRDYIHVMDLAKAHVVAVRRMLENKMKEDFEVFNLGTGTGYSVLDVIKAFEHVTGMKLNYKIMGRREGDIEKVWADPAFSNNELGWSAERGIDEMMDTAWKWEMAYRKKLEK
ncbi:MAG: GDP-mannose 4,6-dehydratase, partial [Bacteroidales bacterium]|nr:GDP-mannose 4,6-dehydratase [Bacteroidales bacterium]